MAIKAELLAKNRNTLTGDVIRTFRVVMPRFILSELNTHRMFSRNSSSSRAIPFNKMVEVIKEEPFVPIAVQLPHKGMQGSEYNNYTAQKQFNNDWENLARDLAASVEKLNRDHSVSKQLLNRILEPFMWQSVIITGTNFNNFFDLRAPNYQHPGHSGRRYLSFKELTAKFPEEYQKLDGLHEITHKCNTSPAEIHIQQVAALMYNADEETKATDLDPGQLHLPFSPPEGVEITQEQHIAHCVAQAARVSYTTIQTARAFDIDKDVNLYNRLIEDRHASPLEHVATAMTQEDVDNNIVIEEGKHYPGMSRNFSGFISHRTKIEPKMM